MTEIDIRPTLPVTEIPETDKIWSLENNTYDSANLSYEDFFNNHLIKNVPCVIKNVSNQWESTKKWIKGDQINYDYLSNMYGNLPVPVLNCNQSHVRSEMKFADYINYMKNEPKQNLLYLKDWHLKKVRPNDNFYTVPKFFGSDWLNEYAYDRNEDDFSFVYMGPKNSWTPMHVDVYHSYSWSVNVIGRKKWLLFPPGEEKKIPAKRDTALHMFDPTLDPDVIYYEVIQEKGDAIFVPSNWFHQVLNLVDTISINHNWLNACNILVAWKSLTATLTLVENEIAEFKDTPDFASQCQTVLKALFGMDSEWFAKFIKCMALKRLVELRDGVARSEPFIRGQNHIVFDLKCIFNMMEVITSHYTFEDELYRVDDDYLTVMHCIYEDLVVLPQYA